MSLSLRAASRWFGLIVVACGMIVAVISSISLSELRVGGGRYLRIVAGKDAIADILPPPLYMIEPFLDVHRAASDPAFARDLPDHLRALRKDYDERKAYWQTSADIGDDLRQRLSDASDKAEEFWAEVDTRFVPALKAGDARILRDSLAHLTDLYTAQRKQVDVAVETATKIVDAEIAAAQFKDVLWRTLLYSSVAFAAVVVMGALVLIVRMVVRPLLELTHSMEDLAAGRFDVEVPYQALRNEVGAMARVVAGLKLDAVARRTLEADAEATEARLRDERERQEAARNEAAASQMAALSDLGVALARLSDGDLTFRLHSEFAADYRQIQADFNAAVETLHGTIARIRSNSGGIRSGSAEITSASDDLSRRTEQQAASLEQTAAALDHIAAGLGRTSGNVQTAKQLALNAKTGAAEGGRVVQQAIEAMAKIEQNSGQIGQIIGVIDEIAFQTNLLALNAGVEAARAGDSGRGFAVVASEVRGLAQRSAEAAKEIKVLISASVSDVEDGVALVGRTGEALDKIASQVSEIHTMVDEIAQSTEDQSNGLREVNVAIGEMDRTTQQNAAMVEESTAASHALAREAATLADLMDQFKVAEAGEEGLDRQVGRAA